MDEIAGETDARVGTWMTRRQEWVIIIIIYLFILFYLNLNFLGRKRREMRHAPMPCVLPNKPPRW